MISEGQALKYCCEDVSKIENYEKAVADSETWDCHHRAEILPCGNFSIADLKKFGLYWHRPACELIFMLHSEHIKLHTAGVAKSAKHKESMAKFMRGRYVGKSNPNYGHRWTDEMRKRVGESRSGEKSPWFGRHHTEATKAKKREFKWWNDGEKSVYSRECPDGFKPGRIIKRRAC